MSTKKIREALEWLENYLEHNPEAKGVRRRALAEVEAIEKAARTLVQDWDAAEWASVEDRTAAVDVIRGIAKESK